MPVWSMLLRVVLILAIALNGAVPAMASSHVVMDASSESGSQPARQGEAGDKPMSCHTEPAEDRAEHTTAHHDATHAASERPVDHTNHHATQPDGSGTGHDGGCCESGTCRCSCMHTCHAVVLGVALLPAVVEHAPSVGRMPRSHATPAQPHLIRPPIG